MSDHDANSMYVWLPKVQEAGIFGMREYWPYKVWCKQVRWWKAGCPVSKRPRQPQPVPQEQGALL